MGTRPYHRDLDGQACLGPEERTERCAGLAGGRSAAGGINMQTELFSVKTQLKAPVVAHYRAAIWTLLILAPVISEVLSGSTRLS